MRHPIVAGNWKMHKTAPETHILLSELIEKMPTGKEVEVIVAPPFVFLAAAVIHVEYTNIAIAAQNMHQNEAGAFTGEIAAQMLQSIGVNIVILGHSERRHYFKETDALLADKANTAIKHGMRLIYCIGEELKDRQNKQYLNVLFNQLRDGLFGLKKEHWSNVIIAYEPVWAIGTGENASPEQVQEIHAFIRREIERQYDSEVAENTSILYGGSVNPSNAAAIFAQPDVDGGLIGGAALVATDFIAIIEAI